MTIHERESPSAHMTQSLALALLTTFAVKCCCPLVSILVSGVLEIAGGRLPVEGGHRRGVLSFPLDWSSNPAVDETGMAWYTMPSS